MIRNSIQTFLLFYLYIVHPTVKTIISVYYICLGRSQDLFGLSISHCYTYFKWQKRLPPIIVEKLHFKNYCLKMHRKVFCKFCQQPTVTKKFRRSLFCQFCQLFKYFTCKLTKLKTNMRIPQDLLRSQDAISKMRSVR